MSVQSMGEVGKDFCPNFLQSFLENIDRRSCDDGSWELIPIFHYPHRNCRPSPLEAASTLEQLEGPLRPLRAGGRKNKFGSISNTLEYLKGGNEVIPKSSPLQGVKAQSLQSLFVGEVTHASCQPCS